MSKLAVVVAFVAAFSMLALAPVIRNEPGRIPPETTSTQLPLGG